jgi:hypothetical protein
MAVKTQLTELKGRGQEWEEKEANRVRKDSRGGSAAGLHNLALTNKIHTLEEVGAALIMIEKMITNASKNSILKESPLPGQLREVETQLDEYEDHLQEWEEEKNMSPEELAERQERERVREQELAAKIAQQEYDSGLYRKFGPDRQGELLVESYGEQARLRKRQESAATEAYRRDAVGDPYLGI